MNRTGSDPQLHEIISEHERVLLFGRMLKRNSFWPLLFCTVVSLAVLAGRIYFTRSGGYLFLLWNIFLAWIPYGCAVWVSTLDKLWPTRRWIMLGPGVMWLLFFPNAPYIVTDFIHLNRVPAGAIWYDIGLLLLFAWTGCFLGVTSLAMMQGVVRRRLGAITSWIFVILTLGLSGVGIYLGRFLRFNSWDIFLRPGHLIGNVFEAVVNPMAHQRAIGVSLMFSMFMLVCYVTFVSARRRAT